MNKLREIRKSKKMSQNELSQKSGVSRQTISRIESGKDQCMAHTLLKLARALGESVDIFLP